jgi:hypothetical protein
MMRATIVMFSASSTPRRELASRLRDALRLCALAVLASASLVGVSVSAAASGGAATAAGTGTGTSTGTGQTVERSGIVSASEFVPKCKVQWRFEFTLTTPSGPIRWNWWSTLRCEGTKTQALSTRAALWLGSQRVGAAPTATCQHCAIETLHGFKSFDSNGAGSWTETTADIITIPNIGTDTSNGTIVWSFAGGQGECTEVTADQVKCATTSDPVVVP